MVGELFSQQREFLANYDWIDLIAATGYLIFDGFNAINSTGNNYTLFDSSHASKVVADYSTNSGTVGAYTTFTTFAATADDGQANKDLDIDFDTSEFQLPRTIKGDVIARVTLGGDDITGAIVDSVYITAKLRKWDGSSETEIASATSATESAISPSEIVPHTLIINVANPTLIKKGEQIRLTIEVYTQDAGGGTIRLAHDPNDSAIEEDDGGAGAMTAGSTRLTVAIPFRLDFM